MINLLSVRQCILLFLVSLNFSPLPKFSFHPATLKTSYLLLAFKRLFYQNVVETPSHALSAAASFS
jgi:hypothetical protein